MKVFKLSALAMGLLALAGCSTETTDSEYIDTEVMWANIKIDSDGQQSRISAELNIATKTGSNLVLSTGDYLTVSADGQTKTLQKDTDFLDVDYQTYIDVTADNAQFTIALKRKDKSDAPSSKVTLPPNFSIHGPLPTDSYNFSQTIHIDWDGLDADKSAVLLLKSDCKTPAGADIAQNEEMTIADSGQYDLLPSALDMFKSPTIDLTKDCSLDIFITRKNTGQVDSKFKNSSKIVATQYRSVKNIKIAN